MKSDGFRLSRWKIEKQIRDIGKDKEPIGKRSKKHPRLSVQYPSDSQSILHVLKDSLITI